MNHLIEALQQITYLAKQEPVPVGKVREAVQSARASIPVAKKENESLAELDKELEIWHSKLEVILKEPAGRQGMARHAQYWIEKLVPGTTGAWHKRGQA